MKRSIKNSSGLLENIYQLVECQRRLAECTQTQDPASALHVLQQIAATYRQDFEKYVLNTSEVLRAAFSSNLPCYR